MKTAKYFCFMALSFEKSRCLVERKSLPVTQMVLTLSRQVESESRNLRYAKNCDPEGRIVEIAPSVPSA
jgi:hypothetical protein